MTDISYPRPPPTTALLCSATTDAAYYEPTLIAGADPHVRHDDPAHQCPASLHDSDRTTLYKTFARSACRVLAGSGKIHILSAFVDILRCSLTRWLECLFFALPTRWPECFPSALLACWSQCSPGSSVQLVLQDKFSTAHGGGRK